MCLTLAIKESRPKHGAERGPSRTTPKDSHDAIRAWLQDQDQASAQWLVDTHRPMVLQVTRGWLPRDWMVDDVVQEVFANAFLALHRVDPTRRFEAWLSSIARNTCAKALRTWQRRFVLNAGDVGITDFDGFLDEADEDEATARDVDHVLLQRLLSRLQDQDRRIFWLYHAEGMSAHGVGQELGLSPGAVRVRVFRSQLALRKEVLKLRNTCGLGHAC